MSPAEPISIEHEFELYLERVELKKETMNPGHYREIKRAFYGAFGQSLILGRDRLANFDFEIGARYLDSMMKEIETFWGQETKKQFPNERENT